MPLHSRYMYSSITYEMYFNIKRGIGFACIDGFKIWKHQKLFYSVLYMFDSLLYSIVIQGHRPKLHKYMIRKIQNVKKYIMSIAE